MYFDSNYLLFVFLPTLILSGLAQFLVQAAFRKWSNIQNSKNMLGPEVADRIIRSAGLHGVRLEGIAGEMTDHFDPSGNVVRMSEPVARHASVASMAIVAHELGHAQQYAQKSPLIAARTLLLPAVKFSPMVSYVLLMAGMFFQITGLFQLGILFFGISVAFMVLTLPVEIDASMRAMRLLRDSGVMTTVEEESGVRQVLIAAALTYIAAAITSVLQLLYYISLFSSQRD